MFPSTQPSVKPHPLSQSSCDASPSWTPLRFLGGSFSLSSGSRSVAWSCREIPGSWVHWCCSCPFADTHRHRECVGLQRAAADPGWLWLKDKNSTAGVNLQHNKERCATRDSQKSRHCLNGYYITFLSAKMVYLDLTIKSGCRIICTRYTIPTCKHL